MKTFKSIPDVDQFLGHPLHATIKNLVSTIINDYPEYRPEDDGYLVLIEPGDVDRVLDDLDMPYRLSEVTFEGVILDDIAGTITMDLSSWFMNWNNNDIHAGTGKADGFTSALATGTWDPATGAYSLSWLSLTGLGPKAGLESSFTLEGVASAVPIPPALWLFSSGLLGLVGMARRKKS